MKKLALFLAVYFLFCPLFSVQAAEILTNSDKDFLETTAVNYITDYIHATYLYEPADFYSGTINEAMGLSDDIVLAEDVAGTLSTNQITVDGERVDTAEMCENISSFAAAAAYYQYIRSAQSMHHYNFNLNVSVIETKISTDSAFVHLYTDVSFQYHPDAETSLCGDNFIVYFTKLNGEWVIADVMAEELETFGMTDIAQNFDEQIAAFNQWQTRDAQTMQTMNETTIEAVPDAEIQAASTYDVPYNRNNAVTYAYTYATSAGNSNPDDYPSFVNQNFPYIAKANCQNFVSQCVWAGFNGNNTASAVTSMAFPMNTSWNPYNENSPNWSYLVSFYDYTNSANCQMITTLGYVNGSFSGLSTAQLKGAVIHMGTPAGDFDHAVLITNATGTGYDQVQFCSNTPMRKAVTLSSELAYNSFTSDLRIIMPTGMKDEGRICSGGTHAFSGNSCKCTRCGYSKLKVTGTMLKPVKVGTTKTITATANSNCYRLAIGIKHESDAKKTWTEYYNTNQLSKSWTFSKTGLYTIEIAVRDIDPANTNSVTATHIFTVRVY